MSETKWLTHKNTGSYVVNSYLIDYQNGTYHPISFGLLFFYQPICKLRYCYLALPYFTRSTITTSGFNVSSSP